ncbi:VanZ family protein [Acidihalobacter ferrooxydans]|uniref:VanZ-like domain-containing protein n=1 Tax=Acidihalobacter ferrooxydans TaxID=1765967 RepID=A0A1P8UFW6_9GAMM|nr:VanZ family protein [Acidihalobacter ferrooxydans]APZ42705.1 hypothetical protein BW247_05995 [Acidihalobacter ferrooxydans]
MRRTDTGERKRVAQTVERKSAQRRRLPSILFWLSLLYLLLIAYASLFPLDWHPPAVWRDPLSYPWPRYDARSDILVNILAYVPLGFLFALAWRRIGRLPSALLALAAGFGLSFCMELLQEALPGRVTSIADITHNTLGALAGVLLAQFVARDTLSGTWLRRLYVRWIEPGTLPMLALLATVLWMAAELFPYVPSPDMSTLKHGLHPVLETALQPERFGAWKFLGDACELFGVGLLARIALRPPSLPLIAVLMVGVALLKVVIVDQVLSAEYLLATLLTVFLLASFGWQTARQRAVLAGLAVAGMLVIDKLRHGHGTRFHSFNWVPFARQIGTLPGFNGLLVTVWTALALATATRVLAGTGRWSRTLDWAGGVCLFLGWFALEWHQQWVPGRIPDITDALVGWVVWILAWRVPLRPE